MKLRMQADSQQHQPLRQLLSEACREDGVTAIEYGLLAALIVVICLGALTALGTSVSNLYLNWVTPAIAALVL